MAGGSDKKRYGDQKGITLIEISVGLLIIGISVLAMYIMFINGREMITEQYHRRQSQGSYGRYAVQQTRGRESAAVIQGNENGHGGCRR